MREFEKSARNWKKKITHLKKRKKEEKRERQHKRIFLAKPVVNKKEKVNKWQTFVWMVPKNRWQFKFYKSENEKEIGGPSPR